MRNWNVLGTFVGVAVVAGLIGRWTGPDYSPSFAQESSPAPAKSTTRPQEPDRGWIGLMVEKSPNGGVRVANVFPGGPSAFGSIREGDLILEVAGTKIQSEEQLAKTVEGLKPGKEVTIVVQRNKRKHSSKVQVGSLREFHEHYVREMWKRDPRDPNFATQHGVSQADLSVETVRRLFEQNERLERSLAAMRQELSELRKEIKAKK